MVCVVSNSATWARPGRGVPRNANASKVAKARRANGVERPARITEHARMGARGGRGKGKGKGKGFRGGALVAPAPSARDALAAEGALAVLVDVTDRPRRLGVTVEHHGRVGQDRPLLRLDRHAAARGDGEHGGEERAGHQK